MSYNEKIWERVREKEEHLEQNRRLIEAVREKKKTGFFEFLRDMLQWLGIKNVFSGVYDVLIITAVISVTTLIFLLNINIDLYFDIATGRFTGIAFAASPIIFFIFFTLSAVKDKESGCYDLMMSCRYTVFHLAAFRMFLVGIGCLVINAAAAGILAGKTGLSYLDLFAISFSSLFLYALIIIVMLLRHGLKGMFLPGGMMLVSIAGIPFDEYNEFLKQIPAFAYILLGFGAALLFQKILNNINRRFSYVIR